MEPPEVVYKYRGISKHTKRLLKNRELYFPLATEINDPFDCRVLLNRDAPSEVHWERMKAHYSKKYGVTDEIEIVYRMLIEGAPPGAKVDRQRAAAVIENREWVSIQNHVEAGNQKMLKERLRKTRLCSFSALPDNLLMWSHYADCHRGICLGFSTRGKVFGLAKKVEYLTEYPTVDSYSLDSDSYVKYTFFSKAKDWHYEEEWRIVLNAADRLAEPIYTFPPESLKEIIFGCQCTDSDERRVRKWLTDGGLKPTLLKAKMARRRFGLDIEPIKS